MPIIEYPEGSAQPSEPVAYSPDAAARAAGVGRTTLFSALKTGALRGRKVGRRTIILREDLLQWLRELPRTEAQ
jgi:excisionase family DNA binding protein